MSLDLSGLEKAVESLERTLNLIGSAPLNGAGQDVAEAIRAGAIQNFEVAYELCWKYIQRWLRLNTPSEEAEFPHTRKDLFRLAARHGLISAPEPWYAYGEARNLSSHTYNEEMAADVLKTAAAFVKDARYLLERLREQ
jgi:nucleotidyltransferase substrate binding protein (TIGR01987 family)